MRNSFTMPRTAFKYFNEDIGRAKNLLDLSKNVAEELYYTEGELQDIRRSALMFAVGSADSYFCEAYGDLVARTLRANQNESTVDLPKFFKNLSAPVLVLVRQNPADNWRWRMLARRVIERDSVLSLGKVASLFNPYLPEGMKLYSNDLIETWINDPYSAQRLFGTTGRHFTTLSGKAKQTALSTARDKLEVRFERIFQKRNDCIHNCDRPRFAIRKELVDSFIATYKVIYDIEFLVKRVNDSIDGYFGDRLRHWGFNAVTVNRALSGFT